MYLICTDKNEGTFIPNKIGHDGFKTFCYFMLIQNFFQFFNGTTCYIKIIKNNIAGFIGKNL